MSITPNTPISELIHSDVEQEEVELTHAWLKKGEEAEDHKYIRREWRNGRWQYWYKNDSLASKPNNTLNKTINNVKKNIQTSLDKTSSNIKESVKTSVDKTSDKIISKANDASKNLNSLVDKAKAVINKLYDDPNNMYDVNSSSYNKKMAQIKETKEWKDIVARKDSEYVKTNEDGSVTYKLDEYVVKKKHPVLDIISDIASGRKVDINEITKESTIAGLKEYAIGTIRTGVMAIGIVSTVLTEKFKLQQGSYDDEIAMIAENVKKGSDYVEATTSAVSQVSPQDIEKIASAVKKGSMAAEATRSINEGNVVKTARIIMESDQIKSLVGNDEYYSMMVDTMAGLSEEEIAAVNLLLKQMRK